MDLEFVNRLTATSEEQRNRYMQLYCKVDESIRLMLIAEQIKINRQLRKEHYTPELNPEYIYSCVILSVKNCLSKSLLATKKQKVNIGLASKIKAKSIEKSRQGKKERLIRLRYYQTIMQLKKQGFSWSEIADYLAKNHRLRISPGYLQQLILRLNRELSAPPPLP